MLIHDLYLCGEPSDADYVREMAEVLRGRGWRVFDALAPLEPGADPGEQRAAALANSAWIVVVAGARPSPTLREQIVAAVHARAADPLGVRVIPVRRREAGPLEKAWKVLPLLQAVIAEDPAVAAERIHATAVTAGLRGWGASRARVAVVAAMAELAGASRRAKEILTGMRAQVAEVIEVDLADPAVLEHVEGCLLRLVLLGGCTAGEEGAARVVALLNQGARTMLAALDPVPNEVQRRFRSDQSRRMDLLDLAGAAALSFANEGDLARLRDPLAERLAALLPEPPQGKVVLEPWERWYLDLHARSWEEGRVGGLSTMSRRRLERAPLYVSLHAAPGRWTRGDDGMVRLARRHEEPALGSGDRPPSPIFLDELLSHPDLRHVVVVGEAGTGKTVLLQHLAWTLCCHHRGEPLPEQQRLDLDALTRGLPTAPVPVLLEARQLAAEIAKGGPDGALERLLCRAFCAEHAPAARRPPPGVLAEHLEHGRYLLLLDALDEVPGQRAREALVALLSGLPATIRSRIVLSTRLTAHTAVQVPTAFERVDVAPLDLGRRAAMLARWQAVQGLDDEAVRDLTRALSALGARFRGEGAGRSPLDNPLLLTAVLLVHLEQRRLPDNLADLYERMVRHLCDRRPDDPDAREDERDRTSAERRDLLTRVAFALQESGGTALPADALAARLVGEGRARDRTEARANLDRLSVSTGLLRFEEEGGVQVVRPWHRSFQEYLAACSLAGRRGAEAEVVADLARSRPGSAPPLLDPGWEGCLRFATGAFGQTGSARAVGWVEALLAEARRDPSPGREGRLLGLAASGVAEYEREYFRDAAARARLPALVAERFLAADGAWPWKDRLLALTALGRLGDPRLPDPRASVEGWVALATTPRCWLRAWPVTVAEYAAFVEDLEWRDDRWWTESSPMEPYGWDDQVHVPTAPVTGVSWYEARAFCRWANARWARPDGGGSFDLPDAREWETAAMLKGGPYPWGAADPGLGDTSKANCRWGAGAPGGVTPVGLFRRAADGPFLDLAGNVWEWCGSGYADDEGDTSCHLNDMPDNEPRVLRGGSWDYPSRYLRVADRERFYTAYRFRYLGLRVVFRSPPASVLEPRSSARSTD